MNKKELILKLFEINAVKFGEFKLKSGVISPIYIDLREIISHPDLLLEVSKKIYQLSKKLEYDVICGAPYTAIPIATTISVLYKKPMLLKRKEVKDYGTKKLVEGMFKKGDKCLIIDDLITDGASKLETIKPLKEMGLKVKDIVVLLDREANGENILKKHGYNLYSALKLSDVIDVLSEEKLIDMDIYNNCLTLIQG
ncbi:orotate phosphoribosyltransferase [Patescibacteria group bacterium]|nr:orotate phosphoribosyltransferase [Patescibacteria group bacterium]